MKELFQSRRKRRTINHIIETSFWDGFQDGIGGNSRTALEYASDSGWYRYNPAHRKAYNAGYDLALDLIEKRIAERLDENKRARRFFGQRFRYAVPGHVYRECYDAVHFSWKGDFK
jgi:hypothetical protein